MKAAIAVALVLALAACGHGHSAPPPPAPAVGNTPTVGDGAGSAADPVEPAPAGAELVLVGHITDAGPIGDGACSQRSYQVKVDKVEAGTAPMKQSLWVNYESCGAAAAPAAGNLAGTGLVVGTTYRFALHKATSGGFAGDFVIVSASAP